MNARNPVESIPSLNLPSRHGAWRASQPTFIILAVSPLPIRALDMDLINTLFQMGGGYVLDFSDRTFSEFFADINVDIDHPRLRAEGTSKAKRLRYFLQHCTQDQRLKALSSLWDYRETKRRRSGLAETVPSAEAEFRALLLRLGAPPGPERRPAPARPVRLDVQRARALKGELLALQSLPAQQRGFAFEKFLRGMFEANGLSPRASFRLVGEQIDGSFQLSSETYLLEARWQGPLVGAGELRAFNGKVEDKAAWSRGLFISHSGFSEDGLDAFGRGKRVICMDGLDLCEMLDKALPLAEVLAKKVRRAAETGQVFARVRDLCP